MCHCSHTTFIRVQCAQLGRRCLSLSPHQPSALGVQRQLGQYESGRTCLHMLYAHERAHSLRFEFMTRVRPDSAMVAAVPPYFLNDKRASQTVYTHFTHNDWLFVAPRAAFRAAFDLGVYYYENCTGEAWWNGVSEDLLSYSIRSIGFVERRVNFPVVLIQSRACTDACADTVDLGNLLRFCGLVHSP